MLAISKPRVFRKGSGVPQTPRERRYTPPKPKQGAPRSMTVAAGFVCNNGIVLGADSEITHSETSKTNESKIIRIHPSGDVFLTYSGDTYFVRDLVARLRFFVEESGEKVTAEIGRAHV